MQSRIYIGEYVTDDPPFERLTYDTAQLLLKSSIIQCINILSSVKIGLYNGDGIHIRNAQFFSPIKRFGKYCTVTRIVTFSNCRDPEKTDEVTIYFYFYADKTFSCRATLNFDSLDETCLDSTITSLILPHNKSAKAVMDMSMTNE